mgnify:CR=1 FL=1
MALLVGLGNVGAEYEGTRHNIGFDIVDRLAHKLGSTFQPGEGSFVVAEARYKGQNLFLIKPTNYMNNSGSSVTKAMAQFNQKPDQSLIIYDDALSHHGRLNRIAPLLENYDKRDEQHKDTPVYDTVYLINFRSTKAKKELNWFPKISLNNGIKTTVDWYLRNKNLYN